MINFDNKSLGFELFHDILKQIKNRPDHALDLIDSYSKNQFKSKDRLLELVDSLNLSENSEIIILGCWYGSILIPALAGKFKKITGIDLNSDAINLAKHGLFKDYKNLRLLAGDVFLKDIKDYHTANLVINTSCEHMKPMRELPWWHKLPNPSYFAFQSNNMFDIEGHTNCVNSIEEFKLQLPENFKILIEDQMQDDRGIRYTLIGQT